MTPSNFEFRLRQHSMFHGFKYDFVARSDEVIGGFEFAFFAQALNARLKLYADADASKGAIRMQWQGKSYLVHHIYTRRGFTNDVRYVLWDSEDKILAEVDVLVATREQRLPRILLRIPQACELGTFSGIFKRRCNLRNNHEDIGFIAEPAALSLRRELIVHLPTLASEVAAFLTIVTLCARY